MKKLSEMSVEEATEFMDKLGEQVDRQIHPESTYILVLCEPTGEATFVSNLLRDNVPTILQKLAVVLLAEKINRIAESN